MTVKRKYVIFGVLSVINLVLDQWTKILAREYLRPLGRQHKVVIDGFFDLRFSENPGVAFGMFQNLPAGKWILTIVALLALVMVFVYLKKTDDSHTRLHIALGMIGGGAVGNLIDRIYLGKVTDFIVWRYHQHEWPAFNIADAALVVGVALMMVDIIRPPKQSVAINNNASSARSKSDAPA